MSLYLSCDLQFINLELFTNNVIFTNSWQNFHKLYYIYVSWNVKQLMFYCFVKNLKYIFPYLSFFFFYFGWFYFISWFFVMYCIQIKCYNELLFYYFHIYICIYIYIYISAFGHLICPTVPIDLCPMLFIHNVGWLFTPSIYRILFFSYYCCTINIIWLGCLQNLLMFNGLLVF